MSTFLLNAYLAYNVISFAVGAVLIALILYPKTRPVILKWAFGLMDEMVKLMQKFLN